MNIQEKLAAIIENETIIIGPAHNKRIQPAGGEATMVKPGDMGYVYFGEQSNFKQLGIKKGIIIKEDPEDGDNFIIHLCELTEKEKKEIDLQCRMDDPKYRTEEFSFLKGNIFKTREEIILKKIGGEL